MVEFVQQIKVNSWALYVVFEEYVLDRIQSSLVCFLNCAIALCTIVWENKSCFRIMFHMQGGIFGSEELITVECQSSFHSLV